MSRSYKPTSVEEVSELVQQEAKFLLVGTNSLKAFSNRTSLSTEDCATLCMEGLQGLVDFSPQDQVVKVKAGTRRCDIGRELEKHGQCIPFSNLYEGFQTRVDIGTIGGSLSINLPHFSEGDCGSWRDWILGMTVVLADGTICKSGSHAVKSVAGYDVHKLFVGARGSLGIVAEVILRTYPIEAVPKWDTDSNWGVARSASDHLCFHRVPHQHYADAWKNACQFYALGLPKSSTILAWLSVDRELPRFPGDWLIRSGCGEKNFQIDDPTLIKLMKRAKQIFDPTHKLNPGEWGFM